MMRPIVRPLIVLVLLVSLSGCLQNGGEADDNAEEGGTWTAESHYGIRPYPVQLHERLTPGTERTWTFEIRNDAPSDNPVEYDAACGGPLLVTVFGPDGGEVAPEEPQAECAAVDMQTLDAGESVAFSWSWDGRVWRDGGLETPPAGTYTIEVGFEGYHAGNREHLTDGAKGTTTVVVNGR